MQSAKDSFYLALRERLARINPARTTIVNGATRPAVMVVENEIGTSAPAPPNTFCLTWGAPRIVQSAEQARRPLMALQCTVAYTAAGAADTALDRGRTLAALDLEWLQICTPPRTQKCDYTLTPPAFLGSMVFWNTPEFGDAEPAGERLRRTARLTIFFFPEVDFS